jgi:hypothetical protein
MLYVKIWVYLSFYTFEFRFYDDNSHVCLASSKV